MKEKYDYNPRFTVGNYELRYTLKFFRFSTSWGRLYPGTCPVKVLGRILSLEEFVKLPILLLDDSYLTVEDVIKYEANVRGGVHFGTLGKANIDAHRASTILIGNVRTTFQLLRPIAQVTLDALYFIYENLTKKYGIKK